MGATDCLESSEASRESCDLGRSVVGVRTGRVCGNRWAYPEGTCWEEAVLLLLLMRVLVELVLEREAVRGKGGGRERSLN